MTSSASRMRNTVCVVGTGVLGLVAMKNLNEQGLKVTAFEQNDHIGGLWNFTLDKAQLSVMPGTRSNSSKQVNSFTDFPMANTFPNHPSATDLKEYLEDYAKHFGLHQYIVYSTRVLKLTYNDESKSWRVFTKNVKADEEAISVYDRVVVAKGMLSIIKQPQFRGIEKFAGNALHSCEFKDPSEFLGKNVLVVGVGSTGSDASCYLKEAGAKKVYLSHRKQFNVLPRELHSHVVDHYATRRIRILIRHIAKISPRFAGFLLNKAYRLMQNIAFPFLKAHPSFNKPRAIDSALHRFPLISDELPRYLRHGAIETVHGVQEITGPDSVTLTDGRELTNIDAIITCSGYCYDFSLIQGSGNPTDPMYADDRFEKLDSAPFRDRSEPFARLYHGILSESHPESLAVLGHLFIFMPLFPQYDLATMAIASLWSGGHPLPSKVEMKTAIDAHYNYVVDTLQHGPMPTMGFRLKDVAEYEWMNRVAGTGVAERVGSWGWEGWKFWWNEKRLYKMLMDGPDLPAIYRLFETGGPRKQWKEALEYIEKVNRETTVSKTHA
ncbi:flavin-binding monooxygenase-like domain-containing protein [Hirsutella rhossiliensis]